MVFAIVILGIFDLLREEEGYKFEDDNKDIIQLRLIKALLEGNKDSALNYFVRKLSDGYNKGDEHKSMLRKGDILNF